MGRSIKGMVYKRIAGLQHARVQCIVCRNWCWTRPGHGFSPRWYHCLGCAPMPTPDQSQSGNHGPNHGPQRTED